MKVGETRYRWEKYKWWIYCVIIAIALFLILYYCYPDTEQDNARYILSAISQGLAAILALVFTITLVVAQMTRRYTAMDKIIFRPETIFLMIVFGFGVVTPLLVLKFGFWRHGINLSIAIAFFCVFSLIPFLKGVNDVLKYDIGIGNLNGEIMEAIEWGYEAKVVQGIIDLESICKDAIKESRKETTFEILHFLSEIGKKSTETKMKDTTERVVDSLSVVGKGAAENNWERATRNAGVRLVSIGEKSIEYKWEDVIISVIDGLISIGVIAARKRWKGVVRNASGFLEKVSVNFALQEERLDSASGLWILGASAEKYLIEIVDERIHELHKWESSTSNDFFEEAFNRAREYISGVYPDLKPSFEEFKRRYDNR